MLLFAADNVDHNLITIDGKGTFHGMGMVAAVTPGTFISRIVPRNKTTADVVGSPLVCQSTNRKSSNSRKLT